MKPSKPSHELNLEAVKEWARSLTPEDRVQWLDSLLERKGAKEPAADPQQTLKLEQELETRPIPTVHRPRVKKAQAQKEHQAHALEQQTQAPKGHQAQALEQQTLELDLDPDPHPHPDRGMRGVIVAIEPPPTPLGAAARGSGGRRQSWGWFRKREAQTLEQPAEATEAARGGGSPKLQEAAAQAELEQLSHALAQALEQKEG